MGDSFCGGETPPEPADIPSTQRGRKPKVNRPARLAYDAGREKLVETLTEAGYGYILRKKALRQIVAWLPTLDGSPLASSPLVAKHPLSPSPAKVAPWAVTAVCLNTGHALNLLCTCLSKRVLKLGVIVGEDLAYWAAAMRLAGSLVVRQQFLPDVAENQGSGAWGACLADDMGLGKTVQALALIQRHWREDSKSPVLLICPTSVVGNWYKEAARFTPNLLVMVHHGITRRKDATFREEVEKQAIVVSSYSLLQRDFDILKDVR